MKSMKAFKKFVCIKNVCNNDRDCISELNQSTLVFLNISVKKPGLKVSLCHVGKPLITVFCGHTETG